MSNNQFVLGTLLSALVCACSSDGESMEAESAEPQATYGGSEQAMSGEQKVTESGAYDRDRSQAAAKAAQDGTQGVPVRDLTITQTSEHGPYLADGNGRALYLLEGDPANDSACYDRCAEMWPPMLAPAGVRAAEQSVQSDLIGLIQRRDGTMQVTYGGHALYYYVRDRGPEQTTGHKYTDEWGEWYLIAPSGEHLGH